MNIGLTQQSGLRKSERGNAALSEYGIKIKNFEAALIYGYNANIRDRLESTDAMLVNSLFLDFLKENGLSIWKEESTRDVICLEFNFGVPSYDEEIKKLDGKIKKADSIEQADIYRKLKDKCKANKDLYKKISKQDLRIKYYTEGVTVPYRTYNKKGKLIEEEIITYKMLYRTPGKAKKGTCMFIREELYNVAHEYLYMGIKLPTKNSPIIQAGAYSSLITSSIIGKVQIKPEQILVLKDYDSKFVTSVVTIKTDKDKHCYAEKNDDYEVTNTIFDGQALIDHSIFPDWADGYILLRNHMTKCAAFNTNIELFMKEQFGDKYETATITDMFGREVAVKDIKLITTNNAIKWLSFDGVTFDDWAKWIRKNDSLWGIVKTVHESKFGDVQRMSYQMVNALDLNTMDSVVEKSIDYINKLKTDNNVFLDYLKSNANFSNDFEVLIALCEHNKDFVRSEYFRDRKRKIIETYVLNFKSGRSIQNADNLTIVGSPYAMLLHTLGRSPNDDPTFNVEEGCIQCWTERFDDGEYLAEFRNPFNSRNNLGYLHNVRHEYLDKYFKLGKLCIAVNMIGTDFQDRNNGSDMDSDSIYVTNQRDIVKHAKYCYENYPTIVNLVPQEKNIYNYSMEDFARVDNALAAAQLAIGESSNIAQLALTYTYNFKDQKYQDYVCILSVLAQIAIDNAKRKYDIDLSQEISIIKSDMEIDKKGLPLFWQLTKKDKMKCGNSEEKTRRKKKSRERIKSKINSTITCPMNYLYGLELNKFRNSDSTLPMKDFFIKHDLDFHHRVARKIEEFIEKYSKELQDFILNHDGINWEDDKGEYYLLRSDYDDLINDLRQLNLGKKYKGLMSWLINRAFLITPEIKSNINVMKSDINKNKAILMKTLYDVDKDIFLSCFIQK